MDKTRDSDFELVKSKLIELLGENDARLWMEVNGIYTNYKTPAGAAAHIKGALLLAKTYGHKVLTDDLECSCNGVTALCRVCKARARLQEVAYREYRARKGVL